MLPSSRARDRAIDIAGTGWWSLLACALAFGPSAVVSAPLPSMAARHITLHEPSGTILRTATIELSPAGLRVRSQGKSGPRELLQDFKSERAWLVDRNRRIVVELPFVVPAGETDGGSTSVSDSAEIPDESATRLPTASAETADTPGAADTPATAGTATSASPIDESDSPTQRAGFLGPEPCLDLEPRSEGPGSYRGRSVDVYSCLASDGRSVEAIEFVDREFPVVVYRKGDDGRVDALEDVHARTYADAYFKPDPDLRTVSEHEYFFGAPPIGAYDER